MLECIIRDDVCIDRSQCTFENVLYDERNHRKLPKNEPSRNAFYIGGLAQVVERLLRM